MKKVLRFIGILLLILIVGYLILCATGSSTLDIKRTTVINAPKAEVWNQIIDYNNYENYSPWKENDSTITSTVTGTPGQPGHKSAWTSKNSGSGNMTLASIEGNTMYYDMHFIEPFEGDAKASTTVEEVPEGVKVTCEYSNDVNFMMRGANTLFGKAFMESMFDRQLELLKEYVESGKAKVTYNIEETTFPASQYATVRETVKWENLSDFFGTAYGKIAEAAGDAINGNAQAFYYTWDEENQQTDVAAAMPVSTAVKGMTMVDVPESQCYMIRYKGGYAQSADMHMALGQKAEEDGKEVAYVIEEYEIGPASETDSNKYVTDIYYILK